MAQFADAAAPQKGEKSEGEKQLELLELQGKKDEAGNVGAAYAGLSAMAAGETAPAQTTEQKSVVNEHGFYVQQSNNTTYSSLTGEGLYVGGNTTGDSFHVDNEANVTIGGTTKAIGVLTAVNGINASSKQITHVADGTASTDAANVGQIDSAKKDLTAAYGAADDKVRKDLTSAYGAADDQVRKDLTSAYGAADDQVRKDLTSAYGAADDQVRKDLTSAYGAADDQVRKDLTSAYGTADDQIRKDLTSAYGAADTALVENYKKSGTIGGWTFEDGNVTVGDLTGKTLTIDGASYNLTGLPGLLEIASVPDWTSAMKNEDTKKFLSDSVKAFVEEGRLTGKTASIGSVEREGTTLDRLSVVSEGQGQGVSVNGKFQVNAIDGQASFSIGDPVKVGNSTYDSQVQINGNVMATGNTGKDNVFQINGYKSVTIDNNKVITSKDLTALGLTGTDKGGAVRYDKDTTDTINGVKLNDGRVTAGSAVIGGFAVNGTTASAGNNFIVSGNGGQAVGTVSGINGIVISTLDNTQNGGEKTTVQNTNETVAIGNGVKVTVDSSLKGDVYNANTVIGTHASAVNSGEGVALGTDAALNNVKYGIAIGNGAKVTNDKADKDDFQGYQGIAIGSGATVSNAKFGIAIGSNAKTEAWNSIALGRSSDTNESYTVAVGSSDQYRGKRRIIHMADGAADDNAATVGQTLHYKVKGMKEDPNIADNQVADIDYGTVELAGVEKDGKNVGTKITNLAAGTEDTDAVNVGQLNAVTDGLKNAGILTSASTTNTQIGQNASITNTSQALAIGGNSKISYANNFGQSGDIALGSNAQVTYSTEWDKDGTDGNGKTNAYLHGHSMAMGQNSLSKDSDFAVAVGTQAKVTGSNYGTAIGMGSTVSGAGYGTAIGSGATIESDGSTTENKSVAIGAGAHVYADEGKIAHTDVVVGSAYIKNSYQSVALGNGSHIDTGYNNVALGQGASVYSVNDTPVSNAVAIGANSEATESDTVSLGYYINDKVKLNRRITHVADGIAATDAATVGQVNKQVDTAKTEFNSAITTAKTGFEAKVDEVNANIGKEVTKQVNDLATKLTASGQGEAANTTTLASMKTAGIVAGSKTGSVNGSIAMGSTGTSITTAAKGGIYGAIALGANAKISWSQEAADSVKDQWNPNGQGWGIIAVGDNTSVKDSMYGEAIGFRSNIENSSYAASYGGYTSIVGSFAGTALGNAVQLTDAYAGTAIGVQSKVLGARNAVALGSLSIAAQDKTISIGRSIDDIKAYNKYVDEYNAKMEELHPGDDNFKYQKVDEKDVMYRRITSVDAGINDHDAVNLGQFNGAKAANGGAQTNFIKDAVGKIDWKAVGEKAEAINAAVKNLDSQTTAKAAAFSLKGASFSMAKEASPTILADEVGTVSDSRKPEPTAGTGTGGASLEGIETTKDTMTLNKENTHMTGSATVDKDLTVGGTSTLKDTTVKGDLTIEKNGQTIDVGNEIQQNGQAIDFLSQDVNRLGGEIDSVGALSAALAGMHPLAYDPSEAKYQISAAMGGYDGSYAAALGGFYHVNKDILLSFGVSSILQGQRKTMGNIGATFRIGAGPKEKAPLFEAGSQMDILRRLAEMDQKISALEQENKELKEQIAAQAK